MPLYVMFICLFPYNSENKGTKIPLETSPWTLNSLNPAIVAHYHCLSCLLMVEYLLPFSKKSMASVILLAILPLLPATSRTDQFQFWVLTVEVSNKGKDKTLEMESTKRHQLVFILNLGLEKLQKNSVKQKK